MPNQSSRSRPVTARVRPLLARRWDEMTAALRELGWERPGPALMEAAIQRLWGIYEAEGPEGLARATRAGAGDDFSPPIGAPGWGRRLALSSRPAKEA